MGILDFFTGGNDKTYIPGDSDSPEFALFVLKQLQKQHASGVVRFKDDPQSYVTMILKVDEKHNHLVLDELTPKVGHQKAVKKENFRISFSYNGVAVIFKSIITNHGTDKKIAFYHIDIPESVDYQQRRHAFRVHVSSGADRIAFKFKIGNIEVGSRLHDISFTGISCITDDQSVASKLRLGSIVEKCLLRPTSEQEPFHADIVLKRIEQVGDGTTLIAGSFTAIDQITQRNINHFVAELERELLRKESDEM